MSSFSDRPFVAGSVTGIRSFNVLRTTLFRPRLCGPVYHYDYRPGENVANCKIKCTITHAEEASWIIEAICNFPDHQIVLALNLENLSRGSYSSTRRHLEQMIGHYVNCSTSSVQFLTLIRSSRDVKLKRCQLDIKTKLPLPEHRAGAMECTCGFYAYLHPGINYHENHTTVTGIIEGYGLVTVGKNGFRAEKSRLLAMVGTVGATMEMSEQFPDVMPGNRDLLYPYKQKFIDDLLVPWGTRWVPKDITEVYSSVPVFPTVDLALAEFPLTVTA